MVQEPGVKSADFSGVCAIEARCRRENQENRENAAMPGSLEAHAVLSPGYRNGWMLLTLPYPIS